MVGCPWYEQAHGCDAFLQCLPEGSQAPSEGVPDGSPNSRRTPSAASDGSRLSQGTVAQSLGVDAWTVLNWELNKTRPGAKHLGRITKFLGYFPLRAVADT